MSRNDLKSAGPNECLRQITHFAKALNDVDQNLSTVIQHLQVLEQEIGGESNEVVNAIKTEIKPALSGQNMSDRQRAEVIKDEESIKRSVDKLRQDLGTELSEIQAFMGNLENLAQESKRAEISLSRLEEIEK